MRFKKSMAVVLAAAMVAAVAAPVSAHAEDTTDDSSYSSDDGYDNDYDDDYDNDDDYNEPTIDYSAIGLSQTSVTLLGKPDDWSGTYYASGSIPLTGVPEGAYFSFSDITNIESSNYFESFDSNGKPVLGITFASRGDDNGFDGGESANFLCRP